MSTTKTGTLHETGVFAAVGFTGTADILVTNEAVDDNLSIVIDDSYLGQTLSLTVQYDTDYSVETGAVIAEDASYYDVYTSLILPIVVQLNGVIVANAKVYSEWDADTNTATIYAPRLTATWEPLVRLEYIQVLIVGTRSLEWNSVQDRITLNTGQILQQSEALSTSKDFNDITEPGLYYVEGVCLNSPFPEFSGWWILDVKGVTGTGYITQRTSTLKQESEDNQWTQSYVRKIEEDVWTDWILVEDNYQTISDAIAATEQKLEETATELRAETAALGETKAGLADDNVFTAVNSFTGGIAYSNDADTNLNLKARNATNIPTIGENLGFVTYAQDNTVLGTCRTNASADGAVTWTTQARRDDTWATLQVGVNSSGVVWTAAPTPADGDDSTQIATTEYVHNTTRYQVAAYVSGASWYNVFKQPDGTYWAEQGGRSGTLSSNTTSTYTQLIPYTDANYNITLTPYYWGGTSDGWNENQWVYSYYSTYFTVYNSAAAYGGIYWRTCGYCSYS